MYLYELSEPIPRMATQLSELHDSLKSESPAERILVSPLFLPDGADEKRI